MDILRTTKRIAKRILLGETKTHVDNSGEFCCSVCGAVNVGMNPLPIYYFANYQKYKFVHNIFFAETTNLLHYSCKNCYASDRDRLYALYLENYFKNKNAVNLLDVAPAAMLRSFIRKHSNVNYRSMDLMMDDVDDKLDITDMHTYKENQFDFFICSHVLEHIPDDVKAMTELYRVLKPGGKGIAMVPINLQLTETMEDPECTDIPTRWRLYGQDDHIRMYAKNDFIARLKSVGFVVEELNINYFGAEVFEKFAIYPSSVLYIVTK
ncbi:MAG TPA: class I SAM-dependent methyltransferase [Puia sp.]|nr:class I SAM-dependent methyltransferase [Puia sp.]